MLGQKAEAQQRRPDSPAAGRAFEPRDSDSMSVGRAVTPAPITARLPQLRALASMSTE